MYAKLTLLTPETVKHGMTQKLFRCCKNLTEKLTFRVIIMMFLKIILETWNNPNAISRLSFEEREREREGDVSRTGQKLSFDSLSISFRFISFSPLFHEMSDSLSIALLLPKLGQKNTRFLFDSIQFLFLFGASPSSFLPLFFSLLLFLLSFLLSSFIDSLGDGIKGKRKVVQEMLYNNFAFFLPAFFFSLLLFLSSWSVTGY